MTEQHISLGDEFDDNVDLFIEDAIDTGCVWGLEGPDGWALCPSEQNDKIDVMPFWSQPEFAQHHCKDEWKVYKPVPVSLEEFLDEWLPGMHEDVVMIGVNWNEDLEGLEMEPLDLLEEIDKTAASSE